LPDSNVHVAENKTFFISSNEILWLCKDAISTAERFGRERLWYVSRNYPDARPERLGKTIKTLIMTHSNRLLQNTNPECHHYATLFGSNIIPIGKMGDEFLNPTVEENSRRGRILGILS
jgi:hypothetical protein